MPDELVVMIEIGKAEGSSSSSTAGDYVSMGAPTLASGS
jgi:hypothetical protein